MSVALIRPAQWPADLEVARALLLAYGDFLTQNPAGPINICLADYEQELADLPVRCVEPDATLLLAFIGNQPAGCVTIKQRPDRPGACELKRLWTTPLSRGHGLGRGLMQAAIDWASGHGATTVLLDTVASAMPEAVALYRSMGFRETARHNDNPVNDLLFFELPLPHPKES